jgi:hypothetical protein
MEGSEMSIDELREQAGSETFFEKSPDPEPASPYRERRFLGLTAFQRFHHLCFAVHDYLYDRQFFPAGYPTGRFAVLELSVDSSGDLFSLVLLEKGAQC